MVNFSLAGHAALVAGSSQGIGEGIATAFVAAGAEVVLHGKESSVAEGRLGEHPYIQCDLFESGAVERILTFAFDEKPALDLLVCNVGSFFDAPLLKMTKERWDKTMHLNVESNYFLAKGFATRLVESKRSGAILITSSTNGFQAEYNSTAYDTSKGALIMMTRTLALSLAEHGIRVNGLAPGFIRTPFTEKSLKSIPRLQKSLEKKIAVGRLGVAEDCAGAAVFLCSSAAGYITGHTLVVDGGLTLSQLPRFD